MQSIKLNCPKDPTEILDRLMAAGYNAYVVGGCVRDTLLGITPNDWDITTSALPEEILEVFRDEHTIPTGLKHGTVTVMKNHEPYEVTTFRIDGAYTDSRHPESVTFSDRISDDLSRRDFTINALAWNKEHGIVDCFSGIEDLEKGLIRAVGVPEKRFEEDALRILRGYRFSAQLGFEIEENTRKALVSESPRLKNISRERVSSEFCRLITAKGAISVLRMLEEDGIFPYVFEGDGYRLPAPEILARIGALPRALEDRLGFLLRGTPEEKAKAWLRSLRLSNKQFGDIVTIADFDGLIGLPESDYGARRMLSIAGDLSERLLAVAEAHGKNVDFFRTAIARARENKDCISVGGLAIGGKDLIAGGIAKGAAIGRILSALLDAVLKDPAMNTPEALLKEATRLSEEFERSL